MFTSPAAVYMRHRQPGWYDDRQSDHWLWVSRYELHRELWVAREWRPPGANAGSGGIEWSADCQPGEAIQRLREHLDRHPRHRQVLKSRVSWGVHPIQHNLLVHLLITRDSENELRGGVCVDKCLVSNKEAAQKMHKDYWRIDDVAFLTQPLKIEEKRNRQGSHVVTIVLLMGRHSDIVFDGRPATQGGAQSWNSLCTRCNDSLTTCSENRFLISFSSCFSNGTRCLTYSEQDKQWYYLNSTGKPDKKNTPAPIC